MNANNSIIQNLRRIQQQHGYLRPEHMGELARLLKVPQHRIQEVASCFPEFRIDEPPPPLTVEVCRDMACHMAGGAELCDELARFRDNAFTAANDPLAATGLSSDDVVIKPVSCLGRCDRAPAVRLNEACYLRNSVESRESPNAIATRVIELIKQTFLTQRLPPATNERDLASAADRWRIDPYGNDLGKHYQAARRFLEAYPLPESLPRFDEGPHKDKCKMAEIQLLRELFTSGLGGMGGAGAPAYRKWWDALDADGGAGDDFAKYVVCNADESEPGTFKDRELLLRKPHLIVEGVILAGLLINARRGYIYVRHEYQDQIKRIREEIKAAEAAGVCGERLRNSDRSFPVEVFESPGGYICGEQSALLEAIEDRRAEPRNRPPEITTNGLYDKPTLLNNVETLAWAPFIALRGGAAYRSLSDKGKGLRFLSISGDVARPGAYEVPIGASLGQLINDFAGGMLDGAELKACATSGPSGGFLPAKLLVRGWAAKLQSAIDRAKQQAQSFRNAAENCRSQPAVKSAMPRVPELETADSSEHKAKILDAKALESESDTALWTSFLESQAGNGDSIDLLQLPLDLVLMRNHLDLMLGAGIVVYGKHRSMIDQAANAAEFFGRESCGKCVPCRLGSQQIVHIAHQIRDGSCTYDWIEATKADREMLIKTMKDTSICGLGTVAAEPLNALLTHYSDDVRTHLAPGG